MKSNIGASASTKANDKDLVTQIDKECQEMIEKEVFTVFPHHKFLGEESVGSGSEG